MAKPTLKMLLVSWNFDTILKGFWSFNAENLGYAGQRAAKLLAVKVGVLKKKSATSAIPAEVWASQSAKVRGRPRSNYSQSLTATIFNPILHGGGHFVPAHVDDPSSLLGGCPKWAHISWLCFIQHSLGPIEAIFKKYFWKFWKIEKKEIYFPTPKGPPFGKKIEKLKKIWFFQKNWSFYTWIWILHVLSFLLRYIT